MSNSLFNVPLSDVVTEGRGEGVVLQAAGSELSDRNQSDDSLEYFDSAEISDFRLARRLRVQTDCCLAPGHPVFFI